MPDKFDIKTIEGARKAIRGSVVVVIKVQYGNYERWVKISKEEAINILKNYPDDADPQKYHMEEDRFGFLQGATFHMN